ncbi:hypothetical protein ABPG72_006634 [Tetrahymena utriculariae]
MDQSSKKNFFDSIHSLKNIIKYIDEIQSNHLAQQSRRFLLFKFIPQLMFLIIIVIFYSILEYLGPITLDLLTKQYYKAQSSDFNQKDKTVQLIQYLLVQAVGPQTGIVNQIIVLSILLVAVNVCRDYVYVFKERMGKKIRIETNVFLQNIIYKKSMKLYTNLSSIQNVPEQKVLTFHNMLHVLERIDSAIDELLYILQVTVELFIGFYYLYQMVQEVAIYSLFSAVLVSLLAILSAGVIQIFVFKLRVYEDQRLKLIEDIINGFKQIKYLGWESFFEKKVQNIRNLEFKQVQGIEYGDTFINFFRRITQSVLLFVTLQNIKKLGSINIFTSLVLFDKFVSPLNGLPWAVGTLLGSVFQLKRLKDYMNQIEIEEESKMYLALKETASQNAIECKINKAFWPYQNYYFSYKFIKTHFKLTKDQLPLALKNVDVSFKKGSLVMIIGKVGAGKTAFFDLILNELAIDKEEDQAKQNNIKINGSIAYACQNVWLQNETIRENILFGKEFHQESYEKCLQISQLEKDINQIPEKDLYRVGFNGGKLSGGQKQRLALCRALYSNSDIYLFDDILSSVDENVAQNIFDKAIRAYLVEEQKKTVIISLNQYSYLPFADEIYEIKDKSLHNVTHNYSKSDEVKQKQDENTQSQAEEQSLLEQEEKEKEKKKKEKEQTQIMNSKNWIFYFKKMGFDVLLIFLISTILHQGCQGLFEYWSHTFIQSLVNENQKPLFIIGDFKQTLGIIFIVLSILNIIRSFMYNYAELTSSNAIFKDLLKSTMFSKMKFLDSKQGIGFIVDRLFRDVEFLDCLPVNYFFIVFFNAAQIIFILLSEFKLMAFIVFVSVILLKQTIDFEKRRQKQFTKILKETMVKPVNDRTTFIIETFNGLKTIRAFAKQDFIKKNFLAIQKYKYARDRTLNQAKILPFYLSKAVDYLGISIVCVTAIYQITNDIKSFEPASICMALAYSYRMMGSIQNSLRATQQIEKTEKVIQRVREFCEEKNECDEIKEVKKLQEEQVQKVKDVVGENNVIEFENVYLSYLDNNQYALNNVSFKIKKGQKVAFCGRTGSGKTSIINCIVRLYEITKGNIFLKNKNLTDLMIKDARKSFSIIPQNGFLFEGKLRDNIDPLNVFSDQQIRDFMNDLNLSIDRIQQAQKGSSYLDFQIEKAGKNLSNGEKQIVNFLQSIIQQKEIIILDEATSNMDPQTDKKIINLLLTKIVKDKTLILISHRLENLKDFDIIYVMNNGQIVESGTYQELMNNPNSHFSSVLKSSY